MKRRIALFVLFPVFAIAADFTGYVIDEACSAKPAMKGNEACARKCIKGGSQYALLVGKEAYNLSDAKTADKFAAQKVKVTGTLDEKNKTIQVTSIAPAK